MFRNFCKPEGGKMFCIFRMFIHFAIKGECFFLSFNLSFQDDISKKKKKRCKGLIGWSEKTN